MPVALFRRAWRTVACHGTASRQLSGVLRGNGLIASPCWACGIRFASVRRDRQTGVRNDSWRGAETCPCRRSIGQCARPAQQRRKGCPHLAYGTDPLLLQALVSSLSLMAQCQYQRCGRCGAKTGERQIAIRPREITSSRWPKWTLRPISGCCTKISSASNSQSSGVLCSLRVGFQRNQPAVPGLAGHRCSDH